MAHNPPEYRERVFVFLCITLFCFTNNAQAQTTQPVRALNPDEIWSLDRATLGPLAKPEDRDKFAAAHQLIEKFFSDPDTRPVTVEELQKTGIDPSVIGRISRIRTHWPTLAPGVYYLNERVGTNAAVYFLGVPPTYTPTSSWPLVIELPTASAFVDKPDADRVTKIYTAWMSDELAKHPDAIVLMPLLNLTDLYGPTPEGINRVIAPLQHACGVVDVDPARVYLFGFAMSSIAAWDIALHQATYFAGFTALAGVPRGDWQRTRAMDLRNTLPVLWQDDQDPIEPLFPAQQITDALRRLKCDVDYQQTHQLGHVPPEPIVAERYATMRKRLRDLYPRHVTLQTDRQEPIYNRLDWIRIDQPLMPGKERRLILENGAGKLTLNGNTEKVDALIEKPNHIKIATDNVANFRVLLNDQLVDFKDSIEIRVNGIVRFEGFLKPDVREALMDQLVLGRGWRYYTAYVDIDLTSK